MAVDLAPLQALRAQGKLDEARGAAVALAAQHADDAELQFFTACIHDALGREAQALPYYRACLANLALSEASRREAYVGLGSSLRCLGRYAESHAVLLQGLEHAPAHGAMRAFLAMTRHNLGDDKAAVEDLLALLAQTSNDESIRDYAKAIAFYAQDVDKRWA
jgi:tetratricopeptide (TPR) repeat protein